MKLGISSEEMDRYLLLVIWGEGKVPPSAAVGEAEHRPGSPTAPGTEKQAGECWAEKERERLGGREISVCDLVLLGRELQHTELSREAVTVCSLELIRAKMVHYLRGK